MKSRRKKNQRLSSERERLKKFCVDGVVKRGTTATGARVRRWTWRIAKAAALAALVGGIVYGGIEGWRKLFWNNPDYALREVRVVTDGSLTREQVIQAAKLQPGRNIYSYKAEAAREAIRKLPQVASVEVRPYFPNRIEVTVVERKPVAWVSSKASETSAKTERTYLLDDRGIVFQPKHTLSDYAPMPVIGGVETEDIELGSPIRKAEVVAALELLRRVRESGEFKVLSIDVSKGYSFVVTNQRLSRFTFGLDEIPAQLGRLGAVQAEAALIGQDIATANLIPKRNIPVTFMIPAPPEPQENDTPEPPRATRARDAGPTRSGNSAPPREKPASAVKKPAPAASKPVPSKQKLAPPNDSNSVLKRFHAA